MTDRDPLHAELEALRHDRLNLLAELDAAASKLAAARAEADNLRRTNDGLRHRVAQLEAGLRVLNLAGTAQ